MKDHATSAEFFSGVEMPMRDQTVLRADILRPTTDKPVPAILIRNPYPAMVARRMIDQFRAVGAGFAIVAQSVRGTGASDGAFEPWRWEVCDGVDSIEWCAAQPWCTGEVATWGASYLAHTQLFAASGRPDALKVMIPTVAPSDPYDLTYFGGALLLASSMNWATQQSGGRIMRAQAQGHDVSSEFRELGPAMAGQAQMNRALPLRDIPFLAKHFPEWREWVDHPTHDEWWKQFDVADRPAIPAFYTAGWWDIFLKWSLKEFNREPRHEASRLVIGPWSHLIEGSAHGEVNYGAASAAMSFDIEGQRLEFVKRFLAGDADGPDDSPKTATPSAGPRVKLFVMGSNRWRDEESWPLDRAQQTQYFFHADGVLSQAQPHRDTPPITFVFDPRDPVPTVGGANLIPGSEGSFNTGPCDQRLLDGRGDIVRFVTEPLAAEVEVIGELSVFVHASTSAVDTDWTAKLIDVWPDGRAFNVADGIIRARHARSTERSEFIPSGQPMLFEIDLVATAHAFLAGHRIRVDVSSSNFPRYDRNPGNGKLSADCTESELVTANQTVFIDANRASWITLPIVV